MHLRGERQLDLLAEEARNRASALALSAQTADRDGALRLLTDALRLDPECVDALRLMAQRTASSRVSLASRLREIAEKARMRGGDPLYRVLDDLVQVLTQLEKYPEAIALCEEMRQVKDEASLRDRLVALYLCDSRAEAAGALLLREGGGDPWALVLERFLQADLEAAADALQGARSADPASERPCSGRGPAERLIHEAWAKHPAARAWLIRRAFQK